MVETRNSNEIKASHNLILNNRKKVDMTGVSDVGTFNEEYILAHTELGLLEIRGRKLRIIKLDTENKKLTVEGEINGLIYEDKSAKKTSKSFWGKR